MTLQASLRAVRVGDRWVVLDIGRGEYLTVRDLQSDVGDKDATTSRRDLEAVLAQAGLGDAHVEVTPPSTLDAGPLTPPPDPARATAVDVARFALALLATAVDLFRPFSDLVRPLAPPRRVRSQTQVRLQAALFARLLVWSPWQGECLFRSRWLLRYLHLQGCTAQWVFGVRGWPLRAHCWVRSGGACLNETPEAVLAYSRIAVF